MSQRCPLCRSGVLEPIRRDLVYEGKTVSTDSWRCPSYRETVLDALQIESLRQAIRREGLASSEEQVENVIERLMLQQP